MEEAQWRNYRRCGRGDHPASCACLEGEIIAPLLRRSVSERDHDTDSPTEKPLVVSDETRKRFPMAGQGSTGNVIAALCSFFIPGLGQLIQGRLFMAIIQFVLAGLLWIVLLGWLIHLWSILDAAMFKPSS